MTDEAELLPEDIWEMVLGHGKPGTYSPRDTLIPHPEGKRAAHWWKCGRYMFGYTSYPDVNGDFFAWTYKPVGEGSHSKPTKWTAVDVVSFKHKGKARKRAIQRYMSHRERP